GRLPARHRAKSEMAGANGLRAASTLLARYAESIISCRCIESIYRSDMSSAPLYDTIGVTYTVTRRTEPRIAAQVWAALGDAKTVLNVGAGTGSYEPSDRAVI